jgi:hypothetical protein
MDGSTCLTIDPMNILSEEGGRFKRCTGFSRDDADGQAAGMSHVLTSSDLLHFESATCNVDLVTELFILFFILKRRPSSYQVLRVWECYQSLPSYSVCVGEPALGDGGVG